MAFDRAMSFLLVSSDHRAAGIVRSLLELLGATDIDGAANASEALTKMRAKRYGLIISDMQTEPITACDVLRKMRGDPVLSRTPFIMTGESKLRNVIAAKMAGADCYVVKPFNAQTLKSKIEAALASRTSRLRERQATTIQTGEAGPSVATGPGRMKFEGIFTSTL